MAAIATLAVMACIPACAANTAPNHATSRIPLWQVTSAQRTLYITGAMNIPLEARPATKIQMIAPRWADETCPPYNCASTNGKNGGMFRFILTVGQHGDDEPQVSAIRT